MSARLRFLLSQAKPGLPLWDIGCDHGLLAEGAYHSKIFSEIHFLDPLEHRISALRRKFLPLLGSASRAVREGVAIEAHFHNCLGENVDRAVFGNVVIAGMGGQTMWDILSAWRDRDLLRAERLILSPHKDVEELKTRLLTLSGWILSSELSITERGRVRPVFVLNRVS